MTHFVPRPHLQRGSFISSQLQCSGCIWKSYAGSQATWKECLLLHLSPAWTACWHGQKGNWLSMAANELVKEPTDLAGSTQDYWNRMETYFHLTLSAGENGPMLYCPQWVCIQLGNCIKDHFNTRVGQERGSIASSGGCLVIWPVIRSILELYADCDISSSFLIFPKRDNHVMLLAWMEKYVFVEFLQNGQQVQEKCADHAKSLHDENDSVFGMGKPVTQVVQHS